MSKFIIITDCVETLYYDLEDHHSPEVMRQIVNHADEPRHVVVDLPHPNFDDNVVVLMGGGREMDAPYEFVRDRDGALHYFVDYISRDMAIAAFEESPTMTKREAACLIIARMHQVGFNDVRAFEDLDDDDIDYVVANYTNAYITNWKK